MTNALHLRHVLVLGCAAMLVACGSEGEGSTSSALGGGGGAAAGAGAAGGAGAAAADGAGAAAAGAGALTSLDVINAVDHGVSWSPLYVTSAGSIGFWNAAGTSPTVEAFDANGAVRWSKSLGVGTLKSGFDLDGDGVTDVALFKSAPHSSCNLDVLYQRSVEIYSGASGALLNASSLVDRCILVNGTTYQGSITLSENTLHYGDTAGLVPLAPRYYGQGWFLSWSGTQVQAPFFYTADTASFDAYASRAVAHTEESQPFHGMVIGSRYVGLTSGRFLQYAIGPYGAGQLLSDAPFLGAPRLAGRSYGLLQHDVNGNPSRVSIVAGTSTQSLYQDFLRGSASNVVTAGFDAWGGIERHVAVHDLDTKAVHQTFHSYAHDNANGDAYRNRVVFPAQAYLPTTDAAGSRLVYDLFDGHTWNTVITNPGGVESAIVLPNLIVWDVISRGKDEVDVVASPVDTARSVMVPDHVNDAGLPQSWRAASYFPKQETVIYKWKRSVGQLTPVKTIPNKIPFLGVVFSSPRHVATSEAAHYQTVRSLDRATRSHAVLIVTDDHNAVAEAAYDF